MPRTKPSTKIRRSWRPVITRSVLLLTFGTLWATQAFAQTFGDIFTEMRSGPVAV